MNYRKHIFAFAILFQLLEPLAGIAMMKGDSDRANVALFDHFETVFSAKADLLSRTGSYDGLSQQDANSLRVPFAYLLAALNSLGGNASSEILGNAARVMVGVRDFKAPKGLGSVQSRFCYIVVLDSSARVDFKRYLSGSPTKVVAGNPVWTWSANLGEYGEDDRRATSLSAEQLAEYILITNNAVDLNLVSRTIMVPGAKTSSVRSLIKDEQLIDEHEFWGYRQYQHTPVSDRVAAGLEGIAPTAEALLLYVDFNTKAAVLRLFSSAPDDPTPRKLDAELPPFRFLGDKAWETTIVLNGDKLAYDQMFTVMGLFGFAIYT